MLRIMNVMYTCFGQVKRMDVVTQTVYGVKFVSVIVDQVSCHLFADVEKFHLYCIEVVHTILVNQMIRCI